MNEHLGALHGELAKLIRAVKATKRPSNDLIADLHEDYYFVEILAKAFPDAELRKLSKSSKKADQRLAALITAVKVSESDVGDSNELHALAGSLPYLRFMAEQFPATALKELETTKKTGAQLEREIAEVLGGGRSS